MKTEFEIEQELENQFNEMLDECYPTVEIGGIFIFNFIFNFLFILFKLEKRMKKCTCCTLSSRHAVKIL